MKAKDWKFTKIIPDEEDCIAACNSFSDFDRIAVKKKSSCEAARLIDFYHSGFWRGVAWTKAKYEIKD